MKFLELNKKRHAVKKFNDKPVDLKDIRTAIEIAQLAPSANNIQPWKFVIVKEKKEQLAQSLPALNKVQVEQAQYVIALFTDTDLVQRARKIARIGSKNLPDDMIAYYMETLPARFASFDDKTKGEYLALNAGLVAMNLVLALTDQGIASNIILGFDKTVANEILDIDERFRPELLITVGYTDEKLEPSYRLPVDEIIEIR
ncbi:nitroreductase family protein [Streptococcus orisasini]